MVKLRLKRCGRKQRATWIEGHDLLWIFSSATFSIGIEVLLARHFVFYFTRVLNFLEYKKEYRMELEENRKFLFLSQELGSRVSANQ